MVWFQQQSFELSVSARENDLRAATPGRILVASRRQRQRGIENTGQPIGSESRRLRSILSIFVLRTVQMLAFGQVGITLQVLGPEWPGNCVLLVEPLAEIHQLAASGTERSVRRGKPIALLPALWTLDDRIGFHECASTLTGLSGAGKSGFAGSPLNKHPPAPSSIPWSVFDTAGCWFGREVGNSRPAGEEFIGRFPAFNLSVVGNPDSPVTIRARCVNCPATSSLWPG
jgi:hypothetical protein